LSKETNTRRGFLRQLGTAFAVGVGLAVIPATQALAATNCCKDPSCNLPNCNKVKYRCSSTCPSGPVGCRCYTGAGQCFTIGC